jgi:hypothetical protein
VTRRPSQTESGKLLIAYIDGAIDRAEYLRRLKEIEGQK